jgi:glucose/arabinose dehydrogenase
MLRVLPFLLLTTPALAQAPVDDGPANQPDTIPAFPEQTDAPEVSSGITLAEEVIADTLARPWAVAVLPGGAGYLVTERGGALRHITRDGVVSAEIAGVPNVRAIQQGGLLDVALSPDFTQDRTLFLTYAAPDGLAGSATAVARAVLSDDHTSLSEVRELWRQTPASVVPAHFGSRVIVLPHGSLLVTTGDRFTPENRALAQDPVNASYGVTILLDTNGNPSPVPVIEGARAEHFTYGHRNIQGAAVQPETGILWTLEHGPAGGDELNTIRPGGNYGWPEVSYGVNYNGTDVGTGRQTHGPDYAEPRYFWDPSIAPSDMIFYEGEMFAEWEGDLLLGALAGRALVRLDMEGDTVVGEERLRRGERVRDVDVDDDGAILILIDDDPGALIRLIPAVEAE